MKPKRWLFPMFCLMGLGGCLLLMAVSPASAAHHGGPATFACVADDKLEKDVASEAMLEQFTCYNKKWEGVETLHFKVKVKNTSDQPQRYRVNIFLDNGKAVGGLIPRKTNKGLVAPGASAGFDYPVKEMTGKPGSVMLKVSTMSQ